MAHNYTNPAFQGEFLDENSISTTPSKIHRTESTRVHGSARRNMFQRTNSERKVIGAAAASTVTPPRPGPKPVGRYGSVTSMHSGKFALVPLEDLNSNNKGRYAVVSEPEVEKITNIQRIVKSQDNLDRFDASPMEGDPRANLSDQFLSLPPEIPKLAEKIAPAFSSDFGSKYFVLYDQKRRYEVVPTEENEELVDPNHEIIQMQNGRVHRYAVIPTEEEQETSLINTPQASYSTPPRARYPVQIPVQRPLPSTPNVTPNKTPNIIATQRLHELLSTPQKQIREPAITPQTTPIRVRPPPQPQLLGHSSTPKSSSSETPTQMMLNYESVRASAVDVRTTAIISPRLQSNLQPNHNPIYSDTTVTSWKETQKSPSTNASMTIGAISLMLILTGILNAGLSLYIISKNGRSYFLDSATIAGFACIALGTLGFKSRQCNWLPNRNYISGYLMVTIFAILDCCGLLVLLWLNPFPGFPIHDVTSGAILGLSFLTMLVISLGVLSSKWCQFVPIDARVDPV